jgi:hypothetical protein
MGPCRDNSFSRRREDDRRATVLSTLRVARKATRAIRAGTALGTITVRIAELSTARTLTVPSSPTIQRTIVMPLILSHHVLDKTRAVTGPRRPARA